MLVGKQSRYQLSAAIFCFNLLCFPMPKRKNSAFKYICCEVARVDFGGIATCLPNRQDSNGDFCLHGNRVGIYGLVMRASNSNLFGQDGGEISLRGNKQHCNSFMPENFLPLFFKQLCLVLYRVFESPFYYIIMGV